MTLPDAGPLAPARSLADPVALQGRYERLRAEVVRRHAGRVVDLSYANPVGDLDPRVRQALVDAAATTPGAALQYSPHGGATKLRRLIATGLTQRTGLAFTYRDIVVTAGATAALSIVFRCAFSPGDEVVLFRPCWMDYPLYLQDRGIRCRFVTLTAGKRLDLDQLAAVIGPSTSGVVVSQPQSPTGVVLSIEELQALADLLAHASMTIGRKILLVSDEAHRDVVWSDREIPSPLELYPHTVMVYSFGKAWQMQGQRLGYAAISPESPARAGIAAELVERSRSMGFGCPNTLMQEIARRLLWLEPDTRWLREAQLFIRAVLAANGYEVIEAPATTFVYARTPIADDWRFVRQLASRGVLALPSALFHERGHFRLALNVDRRGLEVVADIIADAASGA
jgi:aspartate aminotransferase